MFAQTTFRNEETVFQKLTDCEMQYNGDIFCGYCTALYPFEKATSIKCRSIGKKMRYGESIEKTITVKYHGNFKREIERTITVKVLIEKLADEFQYYKTDRYTITFL